MRPGQSVVTPEGPGVTLHPIHPGHPEKDWWVIFGRTAKRFEVSELGELGTSVDVDTTEGTGVYT